MGLGRGGGLTSSPRLVSTLLGTIRTWTVGSGPLFLCFSTSCSWACAGLAATRPSFSICAWDFHAALACSACYDLRPCRLLLSGLTGPPLSEVLRWPLLTMQSGGGVGVKCSEGPARIPNKLRTLQHCAERDLVATLTHEVGKNDLHNRTRKCERCNHTPPRPG